MQAIPSSPVATNTRDSGSAVATPPTTTLPFWTEKVMLPPVEFKMIRFYKLMELAPGFVAR
jgi:hypothetical protein